MNQSIYFKNCTGEDCKTITVEGDNIIAPVLVGFAIGLLIAKSIY
ncbi:hypothetical protein V3A08_07325 [Tenacibaculum maritimum]